MELVFCLLVVQIQPQVLFIFLDKVFSSFSTILHVGNDTANNNESIIVSNLTRAFLQKLNYSYLRSSASLCWNISRS